MSSHPSVQGWKSKVQGLLGSCQDEFKKTTAIGKKMLSASKTNSSLAHYYQKLGKLTEQQLELGEFEWQNSKAEEILIKLKNLKLELNHYEDEVQSLKKDPQKDL